MIKKLTLVALLASAASCLGWPSATYALTGNASHGKTLFGTYGCGGCHGSPPGFTVNPAILLGSDPDNIVFAINTIPQMIPLFGPGAPEDLTVGHDQDIADLAAYIATFSTPSSPTFTASPTSKNFGSVALTGTSGTTTFTITNTGSSGSLSSISSSNAAEFKIQGGTCLPAPKTLAQNASCTVTMVFAPSAAGSRSGTLAVVTNGSPANLSVPLSGTGTSGTPSAGVLEVPNSHSFAPETVGSSSSAASLTITNTGGSTVAISSVTGTNNVEFPLTNGCSGSLVPSASCSLTVGFKPSAAGTRSGTITIISNGTGSPQTIALTGTGGSTTGTGTGTKAAVIEYFYAAWGYYFITANPGDIQALDSGAFPGWSRTGQTFNAYDASKPVPSNAVGVCRFFNDSFSPKSSHFYAMHGFGCEVTLASFPDWQLESSADFYMIPPSASATCPSNTVPVYRLYNNGQGGAPNHRFTTSLTIQAQMIAQGFANEGVVMCGPQ